MRPQDRKPELDIARLASRSHGVVTRAQLIDARVTPGEIKSRVRSGALIRVHRGVYRVGHVAPSVEATYLAAVWACGEGALLSGRAAAFLWGLIKGPMPKPEVTAPHDRFVPGVITHRTGSADDRAEYRKVPITTVPRTLADLAAHLTLDDLARACHEAGVKYRTTPHHVDKVLARRPSTPGTKNLRVVLQGDTHVTLSHLERRFLALMKEHRLPLPRTNRNVTGRRVDCHWPDHRLVVELDMLAELRVLLPIG